MTVRRDWHVGAVLGSGAVACGVARLALESGRRVVQAAADAAGARTSVLARLASQIERGRLDADPDEIAERHRAAEGLDEVLDAGVVIEAVDETLASEREVLG